MISHSDMFHFSIGRVLFECPTDVCLDKIIMIL